MYKIDMHVHTSEVSSCGMVCAEELVKLYKQSGYTSIVITDHFYQGFFDKYSNFTWEEQVDFYMQGYKKAYEAGKACGLNILFGIELRFTENFNDYLVYGLTPELIKASKLLYKMTLEEFKNFIEASDILIYQAHPYRSGMIVASPHLLDGVEVFNGNPRHNSHNDKAYEFAKLHNLKMISGSDFHQVEDIARGGILVDTPVTTITELVTLLKNNENLTLLETL